MTESLPAAVEAAGTTCHCEAALPMLGVRLERCQPGSPLRSVLGWRGNKAAKPVPAKGMRDPMAGTCPEGPVVGQNSTVTWGQKAPDLQPHCVPQPHWVRPSKLHFPLKRKLSPTPSRSQAQQHAWMQPVWPQSHTPQNSAFYICVYFSVLHGCYCVFWQIVGPSLTQWKNNHLGSIWGLLIDMSCIKYWCRVERAWPSREKESWKRRP